MDKKQALAFVDQNKDALINANDRVWEFAETAFSEHKSVEVLAGTLKDMGFEVEMGVGKVETAFAARYGSGKPVIGFLAEYDALSGLSQEAGVPVRKPVTPGGAGHGCGHNCLGAASIGAALAVKTYLENNPGKSGTVIYYGCPGEEGGSGKAFMAREGVFDECDACLTWHPGTLNQIMTGSNSANYQVRYIFKGISSHAAGDPHLGRSALDAVALMNLGVQFLREHIEDTDRIHYAITDAGGYSPNVVQAEAKVLYLIRSQKVTKVADLYERVNDIAKGAALMTGCKVEIDFVKACSNVIINETLERVLYENMKEIGAPTYTAEEEEFARKLIESYEAPTDEATKYSLRWGSDAKEESLNLLKQGKVLNDFLMPFMSSEKCSPGSTDVGDVSWVCPTSQIYAVTTAAGTPGHSWQFTASNKTSIAHKGVLYAAKSMGGAGIDLIENPQTIEAAKAEHHKRVEGLAYKCPIPEGVTPRAIGKMS